MTIGDLHNITERLNQLDEDLSRSIDEQDEETRRIVMHFLDHIQQGAQCVTLEELKSHKTHPEVLNKAMIFALKASLQRYEAALEAMQKLVKEAQ